MQYIIMCRSLTYAQRAAGLLERAGISAFIAKAPQGLTPEGCSYGVKLRHKHLSGALQLLRSSGIKVGRVFRLAEGGFAEEVKP